MIESSNTSKKHISRILMHLHDNGATKRKDLSESLDLRLTSTSEFIHELIDRNFIIPSDPTKPRGAFEIDLNTHWSYVIGASDKVLNFGVMAMNGDMLHSHVEHFSQFSVDEFCEFAAQNLKIFMTKMKRKPLGCGVSIAGVVNKGVVERSLYVGPWNHVDLKTLLEKKLDLPCSIENDTRTAAFSLRWFHDLNYSETESFMVLGLSSGVSSALCLDSEVLSGSKGASGEIGHIPIHADGKQCICGKVGCLEAHYNNNAVLKELQELHPNHTLLDSIDDVQNEIQLYPQLINVIDKIAEDICRTILPTIATIDLHRLVLMSQSESYSTLIASALNRHMNQLLLGHEIHGIQWDAIGDVKTHHLRGAGALVIRDAFLMGGRI